MAHRPKRPRYLDYADAKAHAQRHNIRTRAQYFQWWDAHGPHYLPKRPDKVYKPNFSWNDFLNNTNSFEKTLARNKREKVVWKPFWESVRWVQKQAKKFNLTSREQWETFYDEYEVPKDIPKRPGQVYEEFNQSGVGYRTWLGKDMTEKIAASRAEIGIVAIHHVDGEPANVVVVKVYNGGYSEFIGSEKVGKVYKMYKLEGDKMSQVERIMNTFASKGPIGYTVPDMNALLWELDNVLLIYTLPK